MTDYNDFDHPEPVPNWLSLSLMLAGCAALAGLVWLACRLMF